MRSDDLATLLEDLADDCEAEHPDVSSVLLCLSALLESEHADDSRDRARLAVCAFNISRRRVGEMMAAMARDN